VNHDKPGDASYFFNSLLELKVPPQPGKAPWFDRDWNDPIRARDRMLFAAAS